MSFSSSASRKVRGKARVSTRSGMRFIDEFDRPLDALITSSASFGSTPCLTSVASPSAADSRWIARKAWFTAFTASPAPTRTAVDDLLREALDHLAHALEGRRLSADHDGERSLLRAAHAAADRRVEEADAVRCERLGDGPRGRGIARGAVDERCSVFEAGEESVGPVEDGVDVGRRRKAGDDDVRVAHCLGRGRRRPRARLPRERFGALTRAVPHGEWKAGAEDASGHRAPDRAQAQKGCVHAKENTPSLSFLHDHPGPRRRNELPALRPRRVYRARRPWRGSRAPT